MTRAIAIACVLCAGCTTTILAPTHCETNAECRSAFGVGHVCAEDGYCAPFELPARCASVFPDDLFTAGHEMEPVVFGVLTDRSATGELMAERAVMLVASLANRQGGLQEREIGLVSCDVQSDTGLYSDAMTRSMAVTESARILTEQIGVHALIGPHASSDVENVFVEVVRPAPALLLTPSASSSALVSLDRFPASDFTPGYLWRTVPPENVALDAMAASMYARAVQSLYVLAPDGVGQASADYLRQTLAGLGSTATMETRFYPPESRPDMIDAINAAGESSAREIVLLGDHPSDAIGFLTLVAGDSRFDDRTLFMNESAAVPELLAADAQARFGTGPDGYSLRIVRYQTPDTIAFRNFRNQYRAEYANEDPASYAAAARAHDAAWLLLFGSVGGLARAGNMDAQAIALGLRALSGEGAPTVALEQASWRSAQITLMSGGSIDVVGASGDLDFDSRSEEPAGSAEILVVINGEDGWELGAEPAD